jgi:hypothetical protein
MKDAYSKPLKCSGLFGRVVAWAVALGVLLGAGAGVLPGVGAGAGAVAAAAGAGAGAGAAAGAGAVPRSTDATATVAALVAARFEKATYTMASGAVFLPYFTIEATHTAADLRVVSNASGTVGVLGVNIWQDGSGSSYGYVYLKSPGKAGKVTITLSSKSGAFAPARCVVTVGSYVSGLKLGSKYSGGESGRTTSAASPVAVRRGKSFALSAYAKGGGVKGNAKTLSSPSYEQFVRVASGKVKWKSSNKKVATVSKAGKVSVKKRAKIGKKVTITATYGGRKAYYRLVVANKKAKVVKVKTLGATSHNAVVGQNLLALSYALSRSTVGAYKGYTTTTWTSSNKKVATVNSAGFLEAKAPGKTTIKIKVGSKSTAYTLNVVAPLYWHKLATTN